MILKLRASATLSPPATSGSLPSVSSAKGQVERGPGGEVLEETLELDLLVELPELVDPLVQALGDREIFGLHDVADVRLRRRLPDDDEIVDLVVDEVAVSLEVALVHVESGCRSEEPLELRNAHHGHGGHLLAESRGVVYPDTPPRTPGTVAPSAVYSGREDDFDRARRGGRRADRVRQQLTGADVTGDDAADGALWQ
jgi:hypothetical protein